MAPNAPLEFQPRPRTSDPLSVGWPQVGRDRVSERPDVLSEIGDVQSVEGVGLGVPDDQDTQFCTEAFILIGRQRSQGS